MTGRQKSTHAYRQYLAAEQDAKIMVRDARKTTHHGIVKTIGLIIVVPSLAFLVAVLVAMSTEEITSNITASALVTCSGLIAITGGVIMQRADDRLTTIQVSADRLSQTRFSTYLDAVAEELTGDGFAVRYIDYPNQSIITDRGMVTPSIVSRSATPTLMLDGEPLDSDEIDPAFVF